MCCACQQPVPQQARGPHTRSGCPDGPMNGANAIAGTAPASGLSADQLRRRSKMRCSGRSQRGKGRTLALGVGCMRRCVCCSALALRLRRWRGRLIGIGRRARVSPRRASCSARHAWRGKAQRHRGAPRGASPSASRGAHAAEARCILHAGAAHRLPSNIGLHRGWLLSCSAHLDTPCLAAAGQHRAPRRALRTRTPDCGIVAAARLPGLRMRAVHQLTAAACCCPLRRPTQGEMQARAADSLAWVPMDTPHCAARGLQSAKGHSDSPARDCRCMPSLPPPCACD